MNKSVNMTTEKVGSFLVPARLEAKLNAHKKLPTLVIYYFRITLVWGPMVRTVPSSVAVPEPMKSHSWVKM